MIAIRTSKTDPNGQGAVVGIPYGRVEDVPGTRAPDVDARGLSPRNTKGPPRALVDKSG
jgi:hypothetical protein